MDKNGSVESVVVCGGRRRRRIVVVVVVVVVVVIVAAFRLFSIFDVRAKQFPSRISSNKKAQRRVFKF